MSDEDDGTRLRPSLRDGDRHERAEAAVALGNAGDSDALDELKALTGDADDLVAVSALFACWQLGSRPVVLHRAAAALASADEDTVQAAVQALCAMGEEIVPGLVSLLQAGSPHASEILRILGDIGGDDARETVQRAAASTDPSLAEIARNVLDEWED